jgi:hypothetical protein
MEMDIGCFVQERGIQKGDVVIYHKFAANGRAILAREIIVRSGIISVGTEKEVAKLACDVADSLFNEFEERGWLLELPIPTAQL